ncbi:MAG: KamA family radical SAM protein [Candidatus Margulisiibacteriota bacterium]
MEKKEKLLSQEEEPPPLFDEKDNSASYDCIKDFIGFKDFKKVTARYPFVTTAYYLSLAQNAPDDPIIKQLCPSIEELRSSVGETEDPLEEEIASPVPGLVHRYPDRALMIVTNVCFMNCRHCTRKRLWKKHRFTRTLSEIGKMIDYIKDNKQIRDVILSGGDPLTLPLGDLEIILERLRRIRHLEVIRIGTRAPVVFPQRITPWLAMILKRYRPLWLNTQFNHPHEITPQSAAAISLLQDSGVVVNNQSVLLKGVNDNAQTMTRLCHGLLKIGVRPYYLFHCDPVEGVGHFRTPISKGLEIIEQLRGHTSGLAVPTFVVDAVRGGGKIPLQPDYLVSKNNGVVILRNYKQECFVYSDEPEVKLSENRHNL